MPEEYEDANSSTPGVHLMLDRQDTLGRLERRSGAISTGNSAGHGFPSRRSIAVHYSRAYSLVMLIGVVGFGAVGWFSRSRLPGVVLVTFGIVLAIVIVALIFSVISRKPVLTIDETGIFHQRGRPSRIEWQDILSVERSPRVERLSNGEYHSCIREAWRPIRLRLRGARSDGVEITIGFMGLDIDSAEVYEWIRDYLRRVDDKEQNVA